MLNDFMEQVLSLSEIYTASGSEQAVIGKILAGVRGHRVFEIVCQNPPTYIKELNENLRSRALEADKGEIRSKAFSRAFLLGMETATVVYADTVAVIMDKKPVEDAVKAHCE